MMASNPMRKAHLTAGLLTVLVFLITGQFMRHHQPPMATLSDAARLMFRSRHIYILASGLVNLMLGLYATRMARWRGVVQIIGSALVAISPMFLMVAFAEETTRGLQAEMWWSSLGLYALFGGSMLHLVAAGRLSF
jgi:hypothetical protein